MSATSDDVACRLCGSSSQRLFTANGYWVRCCQACGHYFAEHSPNQQHVENNYGDDYFFAGKAGYDNYLAEENILIERGRSYARRMAAICRPGTMLDIGAAAGFTLRGFREAGWQVAGIEPNARMAEIARTQSDLAVEAASLETWSCNQKFDLITMLQVLPHFVDPRRALSRAAELLRPGGHLLIETWDRTSWSARLFSRNWHEYSPPTVLHWFSRQSLTQLFREEGFLPVAHGRPIRWITAGHAKSILRDKAASSLTNRLMLAAGKVIPDQLAIPYPYDDLMWLLFQRAQVAEHSLSSHIADLATGTLATATK